MAKAKNNATPTIDEKQLMLKLFNVQVQLKMAALTKRLNSRAGLPGWLVDKEINSLIDSAKTMGLTGEGSDVKASLEEFKAVAASIQSS